MATDNWVHEKVCPLFDVTAPYTREDQDGVGPNVARQGQHVVVRIREGNVRDDVFSATLGLEFTCACGLKFMWADAGRLAVS